MSKTSDNVNLDFPARMADGRTFTDYRPNCVMNKVLSKNMDSFQYRTFLTQQGNELEKQYLQQLENDVKCTSCKYDTVLPVQTVMNCNQGMCVTEMKDQNGLGIDRGNTYQQ